MTTPIEKLEANLKKAQESKEYKKLVVLISTGAYNPGAERGLTLSQGGLLFLFVAVHKQHVEIFNTVKTALDKQGYNVIAGFLSPSHAEYVSGKLGKSFIPTKHRLAMCALSCADSSWINVDPWE